MVLRSLKKGLLQIPDGGIIGIAKEHTSLDIQKFLFNKMTAPSTVCKLLYANKTACAIYLVNMNTCFYSIFVFLDQQNG